MVYEIVLLYSIVSATDCCISKWVKINFSLMDDSQNLKTESLCKVCGDKASGKHYGVSSCDGCRGFFKRSIRRDLEYICKENGRCTVDVTRRNQCQACRFKKCLQVNMKRDAVQHERAPRTSTPGLHHYPMSLGTQFRTINSAPMFSCLPLHFTNQSFDHSLAPFSLLGGACNYMHEGLYSSMVTNSFSKLGDLNNLNTPITPVGSSKLYKDDVPMCSYKDDEVTSSEEVNKGKCDARAIIKESMPVRNSMLELPVFKGVGEFKTNIVKIVPTDPYPTPLFSENIYESAAKLLFLTIKWAKSIPSFTQLPHRDQLLLLEESWNNLFCLTAAQWGLTIEEGLIVRNAVAEPCRQLSLEEDARKLRELITRLNCLSVDHTEHACLKALVLFKADCRGISDPAHVEVLQDQTHVMLHEYCSHRSNHHKARFGKLLLSLTLAESISKKSLEELLFKQTVGEVAIEKLLCDLTRSSFGQV